MSLSQFLKEISDLENVERYSNEIMLNQTNVASHTYFVSQIAVMLAYKEKELGNEVNVEKLLLKCQHHDLIEIKTGDILSNVKRSSDKLERQIKKTERMFFEEFKEKVPDYFREEIEELMFNAKDQSIEGKILKAADQIDVVREATREIRLGNKDTFTDILNKTLISLANSGVTFSRIESGELG